jgi:hypothetical protein
VARTFLSAVFIFTLSAGRRYPCAPLALSISLQYPYPATFFERIVAGKKERGVKIMIGLGSLPQVITAIGGLGTAAFGLVDSTKALGGGVNHIGFRGIKTTVAALTPGKAANALSQEKILATLQANWFNGTDLGSQKSIAKSLIKLNLNADNAAALAAETGVDPDVLKDIATNIAKGEALDPAPGDVYARFDLIVTALLDETYQRSDQVYRNWTRAIAAVFAVGLALAGGYMLDTSGKPSLHEIGQFLLVGLLATPLAPIAKDLSTALATAVNTLQLVKK